MVYILCIFVHMLAIPTIVALLRKNQWLIDIFRLIFCVNFMNFSCFSEFHVFSPKFPQIFQNLFRVCWSFGENWLKKFCHALRHKACKHFFSIDRNINGNITLSFKLLRMFVKVPPSHGYNDDSNKI